MAGENHENLLHDNSQLVVVDSCKNNTIHEQQLNITNDDSSGIYLKYHKSEIEQNEKIYRLARVIIWLGFIVMVIGIFACFLGEITSAILTTTAGILTEGISGIVLSFLSQSSKSKQEYYKELALDEECNKYMKTIKELDEKNKVVMLEKLINNYCDRRK